MRLLGLDRAGKFLQVANVPSARRQMKSRLTENGEGWPPGGRLLV
jgi:hypothetical protein